MASAWRHRDISVTGEEAGDDESEFEVNFNLTSKA
jgi:hypothetical protein